MSEIAVAALLAATILGASMVNVEIGISVALIELFAGIVVGNAFNLTVPSWLSFIGTFAGIVLVFQAGAEVDVPQFRQEWRASPSIGLVSFFAPFVVVGLLAYYGLVKGGMNVSTSALWANLGILALLFVRKMVPKLAAVYPLARRYTAPHAVFTTLLMSTGLTFGTITSLYGLTAGIIDRTQFSLLISVVVLSAIILTVIAQRLFNPHAHERPIAPMPPAPEPVGETA